MASTQSVEIKFIREDMATRDHAAAAGIVGPEGVSEDKNKLGTRSRRLQKCSRKDALKNIKFHIFR